MEEEHTVHQWIVVITTSGEQLIGKVPMEAFIMVNRAAPEIVKPHGKGERHKTDIHQPFNSHGNIYPAAIRIGTLVRFMDITR